MAKEATEKVAREWIQAARTGSQAAGLSQILPGATVADAYALQAETLRQELLLGETAAGYKIAFTADAIRSAFGLSEPAVGYMLHRDLHSSGFVLPEKTFAGALLEPEIAFLLRGDLKGENISAADVRKAVAGVCPSYEIVRGRVRSEKFCLVDMVGDNASFGGAVISGKWLPLRQLDLTRVEASVAEDGETVAEGSGAGVMGDPVQAVVWLANKLHSVGRCLRAGEIVLAGSLTRQIPIAKGKLYAARFTGLGEVRARME